MSLRLLLSIFLFATLIAAPSRAQDRPPIAAPTSPVAVSSLPYIRPEAQALDDFVSGLAGGLMATHRVPGLVVVVVKDGQILLEKGIGLADVEARVSVDPRETLFRVASVSKLFTAVLAMQLAEQGVLLLDEDLTTYLGEAPFGASTLDGITAANLLTHTAGFDERYLYSAAVYPGPVEPLEAHLRRFMPARVMPPGATLSYSNYGYGLLGLLTARLLNRDFGEAVEAEILEPLAMSRSTFGLPEERPRMLARAYRDGQGGTLEREPEQVFLPAPAAELATTGGDMARFMLAILNGGQLDGARILLPETVELMTRTHWSAHPALPGWCYGFEEYRRGGWRGVGHGGRHRGFDTQLVIVPEAHAGYFVAINREAGPQFWRAFEAALFDYLFPPRGVQPGLRGVAAPGAEEAAAAAGIYIPSRRTRHDYTKIGAALDAIRVETAEDGALIVTGRETHRYAPMPGGYWRSEARNLNAAWRAEGGEGRAQLVFGAAVFDRLAWWEYPALHAGAGLGAAFLSVLVVLGLGVGWLARRYAGAQTSALPSGLRLSAAAGGLAAIALVVAYLVISSGVPQFDYLLGDPPGMRLLLTIPYVLALAVVSGAVFLVRMRPAHSRARWMQIVFALYLAVLVILLMVANYWNLFGI